MDAYKSLSTVILLVIIHLSSFSQTYFQLDGSVTEISGKPISLVNVTIEGEPIGTITDKEGKYTLKVPSNKSYNLIFSIIGYEKVTLSVSGKSGELLTINQQLKPSTENIDEVSVISRSDKAGNLVRIDIKSFSMLPNTTGSLESILKTLPGVASNNELSSQYSVRGGNFDENLVYINGIEVYRPMLIRSGQQEGMSIINPDLVSSVKFSAGGFNASYGDKMSSVLDITYKRPTKSAGSASISLLGTSMHYEGTALHGRLTHISGFRYKTTQYLLNTLDTKGDYKPTFGDFQTYVTFDITPSWEVNFLGNVAQNRYEFTPTVQETDFGTYNEALRLTIYYDGMEIDRFNTYFGALGFKFKPSREVEMNLTASSYQTNESETFDIQAQYWIDELDNNPGSKTYKESILNIGVGTLLNHARNFMTAKVLALNHGGLYKFNNNEFRWGANLSINSIDDKIREWEMIDSSGYSIPFEPGELKLNKVISGKNEIITSQFAAFAQQTLGVELDKDELFITGGIRLNYCDFTDELLISPRLNVSYIPDWQNDFLFRFSTGMYHQPPFYREMRNPSGQVNYGIKAQRSFQLLLGSDYNFRAWDRPFKFTSEAYVKFMNNLIPYKIENVRLRYSGENMAKGYAVGIDFKINGEFVKGTESWASMSIMRTREDIQGDSYLTRNNSVEYPGYYPRPTDQIVNFGLFFQDYLPNNPSLKVNLSLLFGSGLPISYPIENRYDKTFRMKPYKRVDLGATKILKDEDKMINTARILSPFKSVWLSAEIFNLLGIKNTISYLWVKTTASSMNRGDILGVPNSLTGRRINIKLAATF